MKHVLIIDPSETFVQYLRRIIARMGYATHIARDVAGGLALLRQHRPDLVVSEINFPESDGLQVLRELSQSTDMATVPLVFVSTDGTAERERQARSAGCADYLTKPVTVRDIHGILQRSMTFAQKRQSPRIHAELVVDACIAGRQIATRTTMISAGGMLVVAAHDGLQTGQQVDISLSLPSVAAALPLKGEIVYFTPRSETPNLFGIGIKFLGLEIDQKKHLTEYVDDALSAPWSP
ncbi:response regulator [bacterium]|nr:MAG: response regulator [bacterium]